MKKIFLLSQVLFVCFISNAQVKISSTGINSVVASTMIPNSNIAIGENCLQNTTSTTGYNIAIGPNALRDNTTGNQNIGIGINAMLKNTLGNQNTGIGINVLRNNTIGISNTAIGYASLHENIDGKLNTAVGENTLFNNISGNWNSAFGRWSLILNNGDRNSAFGANSLVQNSSGNKNSAFGAFSLTNVLGNENSAIGHGSGSQLVNGNNNVIIGSSSGGNLTNGDYNTIIGSNVDFQVSTYSLNNSLLIGSGGQVRIFGDANGKIAIGTLNTPSTVGTNDLSNYHLYVKGGIFTEELTIVAGGWADYVFDKNYSLMPLDKLEVFIKDNKHLPNIPSEKEVIENGINLKEMTLKQQEKIEELTLYIIEQNKLIKKLEGSVNEINLKLNSKN